MNRKWMNNFHQKKTKKTDKNKPVIVPHCGHIFCPRLSSEEFLINLYIPCVNMSIFKAVINICTQKRLFLLVLGQLGFIISRVPIWRKEKKNPKQNKNSLQISWT